MIILEKLSDLPDNIVFKVRVSKIPCEDADYVYFHKSLSYYSCYFKNQDLTKRKIVIKYDNK